MPTALVCTSGTAAANFFPAIIEASHAQIPLIVLTADRPPEIRASGANQSIDQVKIFGDYVRFFQDLAVPEVNPPKEMIRYLRAITDRAVAASLGSPPGPVHLNCPFRKPLEPEIENYSRGDANSNRYSGRVHTEITRTTGKIDNLEFELLPRGIIFCGPRTPTGLFSDALILLSLKTGYPIAADGLSGMRFGPWVKRSIFSDPTVLPIPILN